MIKGVLFQKSEKEWDSFVEKIIKERNRKNKRKKIKFFLTILTLVLTTFFVLSLRMKKPQYVYAKIPLKNSQSFVAEEGLVIEIGENAFVINAGVSK